MSVQPTRRRIEPGIFERVNAEGRRLGLEIQWKDAEGRPHRRSVRGNIHAARDALARARSRRVRHELEPGDPRMTLAAVIELFKAAHVSSLRPNSQAAYRSTFARLEPLGRKRITAITRADVRQFVAAEVRDGYKANTIRSHYSALRAVFNFAASDLEIPVTFPKLKPVELPDPVDDRREHRVLADEELERVLKACDPHSRLYFRTVAETGARASEVLGLKRQRIGGGAITIAVQRARDGSLRPLKTRQSKRTIEITRGLAAELRLAGDREFVFPRLTHRGIERSWAAALERAQLETPTPVIHDLRHTHASRLIALGWDPVEIARRLGDRVETILRVYVHEFDARRRSAERRSALEALYGQGDGYGMATYAPSQAITDGAKVQHLQASQ